MESHLYFSEHRLIKSCFESGTTQEFIYIFSTTAFQNQAILRQEQNTLICVLFREELGDWVCMNEFIELNKRHTMSQERNAHHPHHKKNFGNVQQETLPFFFFEAKVQLHRVSWEWVFIISALNPRGPQKTTINHGDHLNRIRQQDPEPLPLAPHRATLSAAQRLLFRIVIRKANHGIQMRNIMRRTQTFA